MLLADMQLAQHVDVYFYWQPSDLALLCQLQQNLAIFCSAHAIGRPVIIRQNDINITI
jgi:hypothetical protein